MNPGEIIAERFELEAVAGTGGMGTVYRARDHIAGGKVALKTLSAIGERDAARFAREAALLAELVHPGIVRYVAHGFTRDHVPYLAMEWVEGETLHARLDRQAMAVVEVVALAHGIAEALAAAHARNVVHRDIKPMNLLLPHGDVARVKLLDFGIARHIHAVGQLTATGTVIGTPGYMAPEQVRGAGELDARTDVFALGCVLYRCLTGVPAFGGDHSLAVLAKILVEEVARPSELVDGVPPALDALVVQMLAKRPEDRPPDGRALAAALAALGGLDATPAGRAIDPLAITARTGASRGALSSSEQRLVSVVLSEPAGLAGEPAAAGLATLATGFGGRLERISSGATLILFAHAEVATDHAARAARCALALRDRLPGAPVVVASGRAMIDRLVVGDVIDRAVAALRDVPPGQIGIDDATARLLDARFVVTERHHRKVLRGLRDGNEVQRTVLGKATSLVGRDRELAMLEATWAEAVDDSVARVVLITAPPGAGKTRLRQELVRRVLQRDAHAEVLLGLGDSLRAGSPFAMLADAIRRAAGVGDGSSLDDQRRALRVRATRHVAAGDADRITHLLGEITGVAFPSAASEALRAARADPVVRGDAMRTAWLDWLTAECAHHPTLLVLEDLHWGDRPSVDHVDAALRELAHAPVMVVALARPEVCELFPQLWSARALDELRLPPLTRKASDRLVRELLGDEVAPNTVQRLVERSGGNAFFLEELIRAVAEGRGDSLPDSVLSILQLRLDALGSDAKRVLRAASVFGEVFWRGGVEALLAGPADHELAHLVDRELIAVSPGSRIPDEVEYAFRHDLIREAAYAMTSADGRMVAHRLAGYWLVDHGHGDPLALAQQFERGGDHERAAECYVEASEQAIAGGDWQAALADAEHGLACGASGELAGRLHLVRAEAHHWRGEHRLVSGPAELASTLFVRGSTRWFHAVDEWVYAATRLGNIARVFEVLRELAATTALPGAELAQLRGVARATIILLRFGPPEIGRALAARCEELAAGVATELSMVHELSAVRTLIARSRGEAQIAIELGRRTIEACEAVHDLRGVALACLSAAGIYSELGAPALAVPLCERGIAAAERVGVATVVTILQFTLALARFDLGELAAARDDCARALASGAGSDPGLEGLTRWTLGRIHLALHDLAAARREADLALANLATFAEYRAYVLALRASVEVAGGEVAAARGSVRAALALTVPQDGFQEGESYVRLCEIEVLEAAGELAAARAAAAAAIARLEARSARIAEPWRATFLAKALHVATLARRAED